MSIQGWVRENERPFVRTAQDWCNRVEQQGRWYLTDFLTPRESYIVNSVVGQRGLVLASSGGYAEAERQRILVMPDDWYPRAEDFEIRLLRIDALEGTIRHRDILGSILGLGLQRKAVGDIVMDGESGGFCFVSKNIGEYIFQSLHQVGRGSASLTWQTEVPDLPRPSYVEKHIFVASLRLDAILAQTCNLSRSNAQAEVKRGNVTLNFAEASVGDDVAIDDILSLRGFGRVKVFETLGTTKSDRTRVRVGILRSDA